MGRQHARSSQQLGCRRDTVQSGVGKSEAGDSFAFRRLGNASSGFDLFFRTRRADGDFGVAESAVRQDVGEFLSDGRGRAAHQVFTRFLHISPVL